MCGCDHKNRYICGYHQREREQFAENMRGLQSGELVLGIYLGKLALIEA